MNLPNSITLSRLVLTAVFVAGTMLESTAGHWLALVTFVIAAISDFVDGWLARKLGLVTAMGKLLDPLADKILVCAAYAYLSSKQLCPVWITVVIMGREFLVTGLRQLAMEAGQVIAADRLGKWKTAAQLTYCITCLVHFAVSPLTGDNPVLGLFQYLSKNEGWLQPASLWISLVLTLWSGANYCWASRGLVRGNR